MCPRLGNHWNPCTRRSVTEGYVCKRRKRKNCSRARNKRCVAVSVVEQTHSKLMTTNVTWKRSKIMRLDDYLPTVNNGFRETPMVFARWHTVTLLSRVRGAN